MFAIKAIIFALCLGAILAVLIYVPLAIYLIPYSFWVGVQGNKGIHYNTKKMSIFKLAKNATILYSSWIRGKKPTF